MTENDESVCTIEKANTKKTYCALCLVGKTLFRCNVCNVSLSKTSKFKLHEYQSCYMIWHNNMDLIMEHHKIKQAYKLSRKNNKGKGRMNNAANKCTSSEGEDNDDVDGKEDEFDDEKDIDDKEEDIDQVASAVDDENTQDTAKSDDESSAEEKSDGEEY
jgi:hypothetical protein